MNRGMSIEWCEKSAEDYDVWEILVKQANTMLGLLYEMYIETDRGKKQLEQKQIVGAQDHRRTTLIEDWDSYVNMNSIEDYTERSSKIKRFNDHIFNFDDDFVRQIQSKKSISVDDLLVLEEKAHAIVDDYMSHSRFKYSTNSDYGNLANDDDYELMRIKLHIELRERVQVSSKFFAENQLYYNFKHNQFLTEHEGAA